MLRLRPGGNLLLPRNIPLTSSNFVGAKYRAGVRSTPSGVSSTLSSVPGVQLCLSRSALGRMTCPFVETLVLSVACFVKVIIPGFSGKNLVRYARVAGAARGNRNCQRLDTRPAGAAGGTTDAAHAPVTDRPGPRRQTHACE